MQKRVLMVAAVGGLIGVGAGALVSWVFFDDPNWGTVVLTSLISATSVYLIFPKQKT